MQTVYGWLLNAAPQGSCSGPAYPALGVWSCLIRQAGSGYVAEIVWDSSQSCSGGNCSTSTYTPNSVYNRYTNLAGQTTAIGAGEVQIGAKPVLLFTSVSGMLEPLAGHEADLVCRSEPWPN